MYVLARVRGDSACLRARFNRPWPPIHHPCTQVVLFEKGAEVGGVWRANYAGYKLQVQGWHFEIPGFPWPPGTSWPYPTGAC